MMSNKMDGLSFSSEGTPLEDLKDPKLGTDCHGEIYVVAKKQ